MTPTEKIERLAELKATIKLLKDQEAALSDALFNDFILGELDDLADDNGLICWNDIRVTPVKTTRWVYSDAVKRLQEVEQFEGIATQKVSQTLRMTLPK